MKRVLLCYARRPSFVAIDAEILASEYEVEEYAQPGRIPRLHKVVPAVLRADLVVCWFASWHSFVPITLAWLLRKPSVQISGGFDTANMPDIGFGYQQGGLRRTASRWIMRRARVLVTNSEYSRGEIAANTPIDPATVTVVHHGVPDPFGAPPDVEAKEPLAITVGPIDHGTLVQKGHRAFAQAARDLPDVRFVHVGRPLDEAAETFIRDHPDVEFTGWVSDEELHDIYRRASVYVQPSKHEGFGLAVAEAMLAGCVPVVMDVTAMPEVVGDAGVLIESQDPAAVADGVRAALARGPDGARQARERITSRFPIEIRRQGLLAATESALSGSRRRRVVP